MRNTSPPCSRESRFLPLTNTDQAARTRFEARGERLGHPIWERVYRRTTVDAGAFL